MFRKNWTLLLTAVIVVVMAGWLHFFYLIRFPDIINKVLQIHVVVFIIAVCGLCMSIISMVKYREILKASLGWFYYYLPVLLVLYAAQWIYSLLTYQGLGTIKSFRHGTNFLIIAMVPVFYLIFQYWHETKKFWRILDYISFFQNLILIIQYFNYKYTGQILFDLSSYYTYYFYEGCIDDRLGLRIMMGGLGSYMLIYDLSNLYDSKLKISQKCFCLIRAAVGIFCLFFVQQTRAVMIYFVLSIAVMVLLGNKSKKTRRIEITIVLLAITILITSGAVQIIAQKMAEVQRKTHGIGISIRIDEIWYYINCFLKQPIFGNGFVLGMEGTYFYTIEHGIDGIFYYSDIGYIGMLGETGLISIVYYIIPMIIALIKAFDIFKRKDLRIEEYLFAITGFFYLVISSATEVVTDTGRCIMFPILVAYYCYLSRANEENSITTTK